MKAIEGVNLKLILITVLILVILIPMTMVESLVTEREDRKFEAVSEVTSKWGTQQVVTGPIITIPYKTYHDNGDADISERVQYRHFLPESLVINGIMNSTIRERGIYEVALYNSKLSIRGNFPSDLLRQFEVPSTDIMLDSAVLSLGISDMTGIQKGIEATLGGTTITIEPGLGNKDIISAGVHSKIINLHSQSDLSFTFELDLNGSDSLSFTPVAKTNSVHLESDWKTPSFNGAFLPTSHELGSSGFTSEWSVLNLNRNYPQWWDGSQHYVSDSNFGVNLFIAADLYTQSNRAIKYALLFIVFTFAIIFCTEILHKNIIHPFQYLLVGLAISIFYVLLLSISEHMNFDLAYWLSSFAIIILIGLYTKSIFKSNRIALVIMAMLAILYGYFYTLMQLEDFALLVGSIGLFVGLAAIMYITKKIDWYTL